MSGRFGDKLDALEAAVQGDGGGAVGVDPVKGRRPVGPQALKVGSVQWEADLTNRLRVLVAEEDVTRRSVLNVLLRQWLALPKGERRAVIEEARQWEKERA